MKKRFLAVVAAAAALALSSFAADAATCSSTSGWGKANARTFEMSTLNTSVESHCGVGSASAKRLEGVFSGSGSWTLAEVERSKISGKARGQFKTINLGDGFIDLSMNAARNLKRGSWSIDQFPVATQVMVVLRSGRGFASFMLDPLATTGDWLSSHKLRLAAVFYRSCQAGTPGCGSGNGTPPTPSPVPLPAAGFLLLGGLGGLFAMRRRRKA